MRKLRCGWSSGSGKMGAEPEEEGGPDEDEDEARAMELACARASGGRRAVHNEAHMQISSRVVVHLDLDCFYAQVEMISHPEFKDKPLGVQQKSLVVTCNYEARKLGVKKLMNIREAKEKCPQLVLVNGEDLTRYREMSYKVTELLEEFSPVVERLGFDENFVDLTEMVEKRLQQFPSDELPSVSVSGHVYNDQSINVQDTTHVRLVVGSQIAAEIRRTMFNQLGLTGCAGVASNKLLAKLVSGTFKPNQQTVLLPESHDDLIHSLNHIKEIPGIGYKTAKRLEMLGINSVRDLQTFSINILEKELGISVAQRIQKLSFGEDNSPVTPSGPPQSFSEEDSFKKCSSEIEVKKKIEELLASLLSRLDQDGRKPHTIRLVIRRYSEKSHGRESRQCPIPSHVIQKLGSGSCEVMTPMVEILMKLFRNMVNVKMPFHLTLLSVCFCNLRTLSPAKKGPMDYYLTPSFTSPSGKSGFKRKDPPVEDVDQEKKGSWDCLQSGKIESTRTGTSPPGTTEFSREKDIGGFPLHSLPEGIDHDVFKQLPADIQEEILSEKPAEKLQGKQSLSCPLHASRGVLSFFSTKQMQANPSSPGGVTKSNGKQTSCVSPCQPGTSSSFSKDYLYHVDNPLLDEQKSPPKESQGLLFSSVKPAASSFHSFSNLQSQQLFSKIRTTNNHKQTKAVTPLQGLTENREQDSSGEKISFPPDIDPQVFYELPEEVQKELLVEWKESRS